MELINAINRRRSARKFLAQSPEREQVLPIMEAARFAHSIANRQVLRYLVCLNKVKSLVISDFISLASNIDDSMNQENPASAPAYIICIGPEGDSPSHFADLGAAFQNMSLAAMTEKLSMCFITQFDKTELTRLFELPHNHQILAVFAIGSAAESSVAYNAETLPTHIENPTDSRIIQIPKLRASQITSWIE
ncbi:nitroreductase family protein [Lentisphaera profundi]|uniref:Nitroreductase family protein n=1 Tax=Lentisphaera profundi TaxID=1658616 RepID=A0ABY7VSA0_9BACT|nr:nitroreductase family protein [Lentisphaera profundi]WDE97085.1 nitroreductase family protein [Lentisphaera profundi]